MDESGGLIGEITLCPTCLKAFKGEVTSEQQKLSGHQISDVIPQNIEEYDEDDMTMEDYSKLGYNVQSLI